MTADQALNDAELETMRKFALRLQNNSEISENYDDFNTSKPKQQAQVSTTTSGTSTANYATPLAMTAARRADEIIAKQMFDAKHAKLSTEKFDSINFGKISTFNNSNKLLLFIQSKIKRIIYLQTDDMFGAIGGKLNWKNRSKNKTSNKSENKK